MTTIRPVDYHSLAQMAEKNEYIVDGHGKSDFEKYEKNRNKYIVDGHGESNRCAGHNCPADYDLATQEMIKARMLYKQHVKNTKGTNKEKTDVEMTQLFVSYDTNEKPSDDEMMEDARKLIERTDLRDFVCFYGIHKNTDNYHFHLSVGAYSADGTKKLCMSKKKLYYYRSEMDKIVAERNLSIIEPNYKMKKYVPEHAEWFEANKDRLRVIPLKEAERQFTKGQGKRKSEKQKYKESKEAQEQYEKEKKDLEAKERMSRNLHYKKRRYIYYQKADPIPLLIFKLGLAMAGLYTPEKPYNKDVPQRQGEYIFGRIDWEAQRRVDAMDYARRNNITNQAELYEQQKVVGTRMNNIKKGIYHAEKRVQELSEMKEMYNRYNTSGDEVARQYLMNHGVNDIEDMWTVWHHLDITEQRLNTLQAQLAEERKNYRDVKKAIATNVKTVNEVILEQLKREMEVQRVQKDPEYKSENEKPAETRQMSFEERVELSRAKQREIEKYRAQNRKEQKERDRSF